MPSLSLDLERTIFEMAAVQISDYDSKVRLLLVAKRIYEWTRPILYRTVIIASEGTIQSSQLTNIAPFTRHLLLLVPKTSLVVQLLSTFRNVENLAIWSGNITIGSQILKKMNDLPLRKLSIALSCIDFDKVIEHCPTLRNITHFEIIVLPKWNWNSDVLKTFSNLTHLCFNLPCKLKNEVVLDLLKHSSSLRVVVYLFDAEWPDLYSEINFHRLRSTLSDELGRFLVLYNSVSAGETVLEWERSANGQIGLWELADLIIEARNGKLFTDNSSFVFSKSTWIDGLNEDGMQWCHERLGVEL